MFVLTFSALLSISSMSICPSLDYSLSSFITGIFTMRMLFEPSKISFTYFDFFSQKEFLYFSEGSLGKLFDINFGILGIVLIASLVSIMLNYVGLVSKKIPQNIVMVFFYPIVILNDMPFLSNILTNGWFFD